MSGPPPADVTVPSFPPGVRLRFDAVREAWILMAPERVFVPDEQAVEILKLVDGTLSIGGIADLLAARYQAPREVIATDVAAMLQDLAERGAVRL
jgi:pyrroloquinoline quinone biosynthesis protein D